jgi:exopolysaccharide biosynthesis polyprenyl glycosylphosphotransferase
MGGPAGSGRSIDVLAIVQIVVATIPLILVGRLITFRLVGLARARGYDLEDTLIVGTGPIGVQVAEALNENPEFGLVPTGFVDRFEVDADLPLVGRPEHLPEILRLTGVGHVILAFGAADDPELVGVVRRCHDQPVQFYAVPRLFELGVSAEDVGHEVSGLPLVPLRRPGATATMWPAKRALDIVAASLLLVLLSPILVLSALAVKLTSAGPVFFRQVRIGVGGRPFEILKFRTMRVNDDSATQWSVQEDDRVTRVGRFLRPTHLDELPQLINVLRGEMSLVGPRPERPHFVEQFTEEIEGYHFRHRVPVGMTGWAQVNGYWGDTSVETRVRLDNRYIENWSLWRDLLIGLRTIPTLFGRRR